MAGCSGLLFGAVLHVDDGLVAPVVRSVSAHLQQAPVLLEHAVERERGVERLAAGRREAHADDRLVTGRGAATAAITAAAAAAAAGEAGAATAAAGGGGGDGGAEFQAA